MWVQEKIRYRICQPGKEIRVLIAGENCLMERSFKWEYQHQGH
uniref:Uncharacterized protein n=1 Tax=Myoviridae sp. ct8aR17 TaxID=2827663 RepID=A0A8S5T710_9CAUD|nr:MAG TPA: hypothetical protein [Myoviridae sp. ct8aR17]